MDTAMIDPLHLQAGVAFGPLPAFSNSAELARVLIGTDSVAMSLDGPWQTTETGLRASRPVVIPTGEAVRRLESARHAAETLRSGLTILAATEARAAAALTADSDPRDRRFLSGSLTVDGLHAYCGSLEAAIGRALTFARWADVVCLKLASPDLGEAAEFARAIKDSFPGKQLGFGHTPRPDSVGWNEIQHRVFGDKLRTLGYDYYLVTQFGQTIFPCSPVGGPWVLIDDAARNCAYEMATAGDGTSQPLSSYLKRKVDGRGMRAAHSSRIGR